MSWCSGRRDFLLASGAGISLLLGGCGFRPLYGRKSLGAVDTQLSQIKIGTIPERVGQQLHNYLLDRLNRKGRPTDPGYLLTVDLDVGIVRQAFELDGTATRAKLTMTANFVLRDIVTERILLRNFARSVTSYNIVSSAISTRSAELDAKDRAAREVSDEIRMLLAIYFQREAV